MTFCVKVENFVQNESILAIKKAKKVDQKILIHRLK